MSDQPANPPATPPQDPAQNPPANPPTDDEGDPIKIGEELGKYKKAAEDYEAYKSQVDPVLQTLWSDNELYQKVLAAHKRRMGVADDNPSDDDDNDNPPANPSSTDSDTRQAVLTNTFRDFEKEKGMVNLSEEARKDLNGRVLAELKDMLDPMGNKTIQQALNEVSLSKLPRFLEKAYTLATKDEQIKAAEERAKNKTLEESAGIIGSMPSGSVETSEITLTQKEREIARKQGISEEKFLENKKKIFQRNSLPNY